MNKGFYFSLDAAVALGIVGIVTLMLVGTSTPEGWMMDQTVYQYSQINNIGTDAIEMASNSQMNQFFNGSTVEEYIEETPLEREDTKKSVLDVIAILWASDRDQEAGELSKQFFGDIFSKRYEYRISIDGDSKAFLINSSQQGQSDTRSNAERVVSGAERGRPQQGYIARASASAVEKNETEVMTFSPMGGANGGDSLNIWKEFNVSDTTDVDNAQMYVAVHYGCEVGTFETLEVNGHSLRDDIDWIHKEANCPFFEFLGSGTGAYGGIDNITEHLVNGTNTVYIDFSNDRYNAHTHPGMKLEMELTGQEAEPVASPVREKIDFDRVLTTDDANTNSGAFAVKPFAIPRGGSVQNATLHLRAEDIEQVYEEVEASCGGGEEQTLGDVMVYFNGDQIYRDEAPSDGTVDLTLDLTDESQEGTNVVATYLNTYGDCFWGEGKTLIKANNSDTSGSYINVTYSRPEDTLAFGRIELTRNEQLGGGLENPKAYTKDFEGANLQDSFLNVAQLFSNQVSVDVTDAAGNEEQVFQSSGVRSVPSSIFIDASYYSETGGNTVKMEDATDTNDFLPESSLEYTLLVPSQVPYGDTFQDREDAKEDAVERLNNTLGEYVDATEISSEAQTVGDVPWLFGPVTFQIEVWRE